MLIARLPEFSSFIWHTLSGSSMVRSLTWLFYLPAVNPSTLERGQRGRQKESRIKGEGMWEEKEADISEVV